MARTPDRSPGPLDEEEILLETNTSPTAVAGSITFDGSSFVLRDATGVFDPRSGGSGISEGQHEGLDTLVHDVAETSYTEVTRTSGQVSSVIVWETSAKLKKIRETTVTRTSGQASTIVEKHYDAAGTVIAGQTLTHTVTRSGGRVESIDTVQT